MGPPSGSDLQGIGGGALPGSPVYNGLWGGGVFNGWAGLVALEVNITYQFWAAAEYTCC